MEIVSNNNINLFDIENSILKSRGIKDIQEFISPTGKYIESYYSFGTMKNAIDLFNYHRFQNHKMMILVDCDVDGYTSSAIMYTFCKDFNCRVSYVLHEDKSHGLDNKTMKFVTEEQPQLLIIPDAGSNDISQIKELLSNKIDVLILDHHEIENKEDFCPLISIDSNKCVIVNNQIEKKIKDKSMTGVGIVYKFLKAMEDYMYYNIYSVDSFLDLVAIGMIGDVCDLTDLQSRYYVYKGLTHIKTNFDINPFIKILCDKQSSKMNNQITINGIAFYVVPLIASVIRFGTMEQKNTLFMALSREGYNSDIALKDCLSCKKYQDELSAKSLELLDTQIEKYHLNDKPIIICNAKEINSNATGLVASKVATKYKKPCLLLRKNSENILFGSGRNCRNGFTNNFLSFLKNADSKLKCFTALLGHENAFGVGINYLKIQDFFKYILQLNLPEPKILVDNDFNILDYDIIKRVADMEYLWGCGISEPVFSLSNYYICNNDIQIIGKKSNTLNITYKEQFCDQNIKMIWFNVPQGTIDKLIHNNLTKCNIVFKCKKNLFKGKQNYQIIIDELEILEENN